MSGGTPDDVSEILQAWSDGDPRALERLTPVVYDELRRLARRYMRRERPGHSLQSAALVNEAYLRLVDYKRMRWQNRAHFFAVSAQLMRRILVDHARRRNQKRGGGVPHVSLDDAAVVGGETGHRFRGARRCDEGAGAHRSAQSPGRRNAVLRRPERRRNRRRAQGVAEVTVMRDWSSAKAWLYRELTGGTGDGR